MHIFPVSPGRFDQDCRTALCRGLTGNAVTPAGADAPHARQAGSAHPEGLALPTTRSTHSVSPASEAEAAGAARNGPRGSFNLFQSALHVTGGGPDAHRLS